jgi:menaquinol-cytochrome c reductase iron-sulfur subunit
VTDTPEPEGAASAPAETTPTSPAPDAGESIDRTGRLGGALSRRSFVVKSLAAVGGVTAALVAVPVIGFATAPGWKAGTPVRFLSTSVAPTLRSDTWTSVGKLAEFETGIPRYVQVERHVVDGWVQENAPVGVHVVRRSDTEADVFDPHCTHLGCPLAWSDGAGSFVCPCHGGSFGADGNVKSGPPPRPMVRYETKVENGELFIGALPAGA